MLHFRAIEIIIVTAGTCVKNHAIDGCQYLGKCPQFADC